MKVYRQSTSFTCGPACVLMALSHFFSRINQNRGKQLEIWSESVVPPIKGTSAFGLAYSLRKRGLNARVIASLKFSLNYVPKGWRNKDFSTD